MTRPVIDSERIGVLPQWAQELIEKLNKALDAAESDSRRLRTINHVLGERDWFSIPGPAEGQQPRKLWVIDRDQPTPVCELRVGDVLLIGKNPNRFKQELQGP